MADIIEIIQDVTTLTVASDGPQGPTGPTGATGATGAQGPSGVLSVTAPITNSGTSTSAVIGINAGVANGVATLDSGGKVPQSQIPAVAITNTFVVASQAAMLALTAEEGDVAVRTDLNKTYILAATPASTLGNWQELLTPTDSVTSVDGRVGAVTLTDKYAQLATANTFTLGPNIFQSGAIGNVALIARAATGQTANIQEWRDGSNSNVMRLTNTGSLILNTGQGISTQYLTGVSQGAGAYIETSSTHLYAQTRAATNIGLIVKGAASQTADLQQWQNSAGTVLANIDSTGNIYSSASNIWAGYNRAADGAALFRFTTVATATYEQSFISRGSGFNGNLTISNAGTGTIVVTNQSASAISLVVKGIASQTGNLQEWQNSAGTVLAKVLNTGAVYGATLATINSLVIIGEQSSGGSVRMTKLTAAGTNPGAGEGRIYFRDGTNAGTLKLVVRAGAAGAETTVLDNIPQ